MQVRLILALQNLVTSSPPVCFLMAALAPFQARCLSSAGPFQPNIRRGLADHLGAAAVIPGDVVWHPQRQTLYFAPCEG
ncbi:MAG: hypothetical protein ACLTXH_08645 [Enterobacter hormaechei]